MSDTERPQIPPHVRSLAHQTLDALLRIEELLQQGLTERAIAAKADVVIEAPTEEKPVANRRRRS